MCASALLVAVCVMVTGNVVVVVVVVAGRVGATCAGTLQLACGDIGSWCALCDGALWNECAARW